MTRNADKCAINADIHRITADICHFFADKIRTFADIHHHTADNRPFLNKQKIVR